jgi:tetratricopeptide (TPR) repeat protein
MAPPDTPDAEAEATLRRRIAEGSQDPEDYCKFTDLLFSSGRYDEAISFHKQALTLPLTTSKKAQLYMELGWLEYEIGQRSQAIASARDALSLLTTEPRSAEVLYYLGSSQALLAFCLSVEDPNGGPDAAHVAIEWLEQALGGPFDFEDKAHARIDAARLHNWLGNWDKAIRHCETCLRLEINEMQRISCLIVYAQALRSEERFSEAEQAITEAFQYGANVKSGCSGRSSTRNSGKYNALQISSGNQSKILRRQLRH